MTTLQSRLKKTLAKYEAEYLFYADLIYQPRIQNVPDAVSIYKGWMEQTWAGRCSIKEALRLLESNAAEED